MDRITMLESHTTKVAVAIAALIGLTAFGTLQIQDGNFLQDGEEEELDQLRIGHVPGPLTSPHYTAIEEGFYEEEGFDAEMVQMPGPEIGQALLNGNLEIGSSATTPAAYQRNNDLPIKLVASRAGYSEEGPGAYMVVDNESDIESAEDFEGKTLCVSTAGSMGELWIQQWAENNGLEHGEDYDFTYLGDETQYSTAFASDSVDGCFLDVAEPTFTLLNQDNLVRKTHEMERGDYVAAFVAVRQEWLEEEPEKVERFLRAYAKAAEYARNNPDERIENVAKHSHYSEELLEEANLPEVPEDLTVDVSVLNDVQGMMVDYRMMEEELEMGDMVHNEAIRNVQEETE